MTVRGVNAEAVLDLMQRRSADDPAPSRKIALVIEGGGMRGVYSAGSLLALEFLGYRTVFDEVYATSAGAINAAYFLSGQGSFSISMYYRNINNSKFINPFRLHKIADIDYVYDTVISRLCPLDVDAMVSSEPQLFVSVTDYETPSGLVVDIQACETSPVDVLKASSALPLLYNKTVEVAGRPCIDGGLSNLLPIEQAVANGCTDVLVVLTRPAWYRNQAPGRLQRFLFNRLFARGNEKLESMYAESHTRDNRSRDLALGRICSRPVNIATICPAGDDTKVSRLTKNAERLKAAARRQGRRTMKIFGGDPAEFIEYFEGLSGFPDPS